MVATTDLKMIANNKGNGLITTGKRKGRPTLW